MNKKVIIGICAGISVVVIAAIAFFGFRISKKTEAARTAASEFVSLLQNAEMERLSLGYYAHTGIENAVYRDENGNVIGQTLTKQQVAEIYGVDAVMSISEEEAGEMEGDSDIIDKEDLLNIIMKHTQMMSNVGTIWGEKGTMNLQMMMPDLKTWLQNVSEDELHELNAIESNREFLQALDAKMESGEIELSYVQVKIPMVLQNGKWRFEVTEDIEHMFFGGLYQLFDVDEAEVS